MFSTIINFYMFFGALFAFIISLGQFVQKRKALINFIYGLSFLGLSIWLFQLSIYSSGIFDNSSGIAFIKLATIPVTFLVPPLMVLRYRWIIISNFRIKRIHFLLFLPALAALILVLIPFIAGPPLKPEYLAGKPILGKDFAAMPPLYQIIYSLYLLPHIYLISGLVPTLIKMVIVWKKTPGGGSMKVSRAGYIFAFLIFFTNLLAVGGDLFSMDLMRFAMCFCNTTMTCLYLATQRQPDFHRLLKIEARIAQYEHSRIRGLDVDSIIARLRDIMEQEKAFADEELTLSSLARDLGVSPHQLSQILNEKLGKNFNTFVNEYRVEEAKDMLVHEPERSILSISVAAGFNSVTTFNTVFSKICGMTPSKYRKKHQ